MTEIDEKLAQSTFAYVEGLLAACSLYQVCWQVAAFGRCIFVQAKRELLLMQRKVIAKSYLMPNSFYDFKMVNVDATPHNNNDLAINYDDYLKYSVLLLRNSMFFS